jgi:hypothetical protein
LREIALQNIERMDEYRAKYKSEWLKGRILDESSRSNYRIKSKASD